MAVQIENLGSLDRKMTLEFARADLAKAREARLAKVGKTMKMAGFRPGKVPKNLVEKQYGMQVDFELQFDKASELFFEQSQKEGIKLAGQPRLEPKSELDADTVVFDAFFEVLPEVKIGDFSKAEVTKYTTEIGEAEIDRGIPRADPARRPFLAGSINRRKHSHHVAAGEGRPVQHLFAIPVVSNEIERKGVPNSR